MADSDDSKAEASAQKAYAAAAEAAGEKDEVAAPPPEVAAEPVEFPAKPKRARKAPAAAAQPAAEPVIAPAVAAEPVAPIAEAVPAEVAKSVAAPKPRRVAANPLKAPKAVKAAKPVAKLAVKRAVAKPAAAPVAKPVALKVRKPAVQKIKTAPKAAAKPVKASPTAAPTISFIDQLKEIPMDMTTSIKDAVSGAQDKAKEAFTKTSAVASEYGEFAKGNVEAVVEAGKILASGLQEMGNKFIADSKTAFETASADVKALTAVKSPTEFFQFQTDLLKRNFESAVSYGTKTSEAMLKLSGDVIKPISGRVTLAVEKVKAAA